MSDPTGEWGAEPAGKGTSALLLDAVAGEGDRVTVGQILDKLDARAFGLGVLLFSLPSIVPMPPGVPTVVGVALLIVSLQMVVGRQELWLPGFLSKRSFSRPSLVSALGKIRPQLESLEKICRPRLMFLTGSIGTVLIGVVVLVMAIVLILPLPPGGNFPPALACAVLGMGLAERDGIIVLAGIATTIAASVAVWFVTIQFIEYAPSFFDWIRSLFGG